MQSAISTRRVWFIHAECNFTTQSVISTRRVWCWDVWVWLRHSQNWLWHSYVIKPHSACRNHFCVWWTHVRMQFMNAKCDFNTHECDLFMQSAIFTRRVWFLQAECDFYTYECDYDTHESDYDTSTVLKPHFACRSHSYVWCSYAYWIEQMHEFNFWTQNVISTRTRVIYTRRVWFWHVWV
jgi:hypothetical protein